MPANEAGLSKSPAASRIWVNVAVALCSILISFALVEVALRVLVEPSPDSSGRVFGLKLPPLRVLPSDYLPDSQDAVARSEQPYRSVIVNGIAVTHGDLFGVMREDPVLAYAPRENTASKHRWWRSNNVGARQERDMAPARTPGRPRALLFGDSYTQGSRVPQEDTYTYVLGAMRPEAEIVNFGTDGYSTGQSYLRYLNVAESLEFDVAVLVTVPSVNLWRDISVSRYIGEGWPTYKLQPRFHLAHGKLELARSPFPDLAAQLTDGPAFETVRRHLLAHDAFYFPQFEPSPLADHFLTARLFRRIIAGVKRRGIQAEIRSPQSEAMQVTRAIIGEFQQHVVTLGAEFVLIVLPTHADIASYRDSRSFRESWDAMRASLCEPAGACVDMMPPLSALPAGNLDYGYDGTHYGSKANRSIATTLAESIPLAGRR